MHNGTLSIVAMRIGDPDRSPARIHGCDGSSFVDMTNTLALVTTNQQSTKLEMIVVSWVHNTANRRYIEISATNSTVGQLLVRVTSPNTVEAQRRLSEFHDKLLAAMGRFNTQITAYTGTASLPPDELDIDLSKRLVYLIVEP